MKILIMSFFSFVSVSFDHRQQLCLMCRSLCILFLPSHKSSSIDYLLWLIQYHTMGLRSQFSLDSLNQPSNIANMLLLNLKFRIKFTFLFFFHAQMSTYMHRTNITICFKSNKYSSDNHVCSFVSIHVGGNHVDGVPLSVVDTVSCLIYTEKQNKLGEIYCELTFFYKPAGTESVGAFLIEKGDSGEEIIVVIQLCISCEYCISFNLHFSQLT